MKLLYVHNADFGTFSANKIQVLNMCEAFKDNSVDIELMGFSKKCNILDIYGVKNKFPIILLNTGGNYYLRTLRLLMKAVSIRKKHHNIFTRDLMFAYLTSRLFPKNKIIYELHDYSRKGLWKHWFKKTFEKTDKTVVISEGLRDDLVKDGYDPAKIIVLHDGVSIQKFDLNITQKEARAALNLPTGCTIILYSGSFQDWKGYKTVINASKSNKNPHIKFLMVGGTKEQIKDLSKKNPQVIFKEFMSPEQMPTLLKASDILLIPNSPKDRISSHYTSPLKLFEYMASKRPVIASDIPSIRNICTDKELTFFKPDDAQDLYTKIKQVITDRKNTEKRVEAAFKKVKSYDWKRRAETISREYRVS